MHQESLHPGQHRHVKSSMLQLMASRGNIPHPSAGRQWEQCAYLSVDAKSTNIIVVTNLNIVYIVTESDVKAVIKL